MLRSTEELCTYFNDAADRWDMVNHCKSENLKRIVELSGIRKDDTVLDLACGTGVLTEYLLTVTPHVVGLDLSEKMIAHARKKFAGTTARFLSGDFYAFGKERFDVVILHNAYPHFGDKERLVSCLAEVLRPRGRLTVAHSIGREHVNKVHQDRAGCFSVPLQPVNREAGLFAEKFEIDFMADEADFYAFSGRKR